MIDVSSADNVNLQIIYETYKNIFFVLKIFALETILDKNKKSAVKDRINICYLILHCCVTLLLFASNSASFVLMEKDVKRVCFYLYTLLICVNSVLGPILLIQKNERQHNLYREMAKVDYLFDKLGLSVNTNYKKKIVLNTFALYFSASVISGIFASYLIPVPIQGKIIIFLGLVIKTLIYCKCCVIINMIQQRICLILEALKRYFKNGTVLSDNERLFLLSRIHSDLFKNATELMDIFEPVLLLSSSVKFATTFGISYILYKSVENLNNIHSITCSVAICIFLLCQATIIIKSFTSLADEANKFGTELHRIQFTKEDEILQRDVQTYSLQALHKRLSFTLCDLFPINFTILFSTFAALCAFLIIIVDYEHFNLA